MVMEQSPIIEYYPVNFNTDLNGKQHDWEAVVLIPFIDEVSLYILIVTGNEFHQFNYVCGANYVTKSSQLAFHCFSIISGC